MGLREYKVFVRQNSKTTLDYLFTKYKQVMNSFMELDYNKTSIGSYLFIWYAQIIDSRTNKIYYVFCDYGTDLYNIQNSYTTENGKIIKGVIDTTPFIGNDGSISTSSSSKVYPV